MKSLNDNYSSSHSGSHETFADLMFCALVVLVLFVMALAIEVSQRVKAELVIETPKPIPVIENTELADMTKEEVAELSKKLQTQSNEIIALHSKLELNAQLVEKQKHVVNSQIAALNGEQRFTGAREPASLTMSYDFTSQRYYFVSARESEHADRRNSGESLLEFSQRKTSELIAIALKARKQRGYTQDEAKSIYRAFSSYKEVEPTFESYKIVDSVVGISYHTTLAGYIAGETDMSETMENLVIGKLLEIYKEKGAKSDDMYPKTTLQIDLDKRKITINNVVLSPRDAKEILLSLDGRGAMLDLEGLSGKAPSWLREEVLIPAGYISKVPKLPKR